MKGCSVFPKAPALLGPHRVITGPSLGVGSYPSAEVQSVYSTAPADWATVYNPVLCKFLKIDILPDISVRTIRDTNFVCA